MPNAREPQPQRPRPSGLDRSDAEQAASRSRLVPMAAAIVLPLFIGLLLASTVRLVRVGDGADYLLAAWSLRESCSPAFDDEAVDDFQGSMKESGVTMGGRITAEKIGLVRTRAPESGREVLHFWWYSLLAVPFTYLAEAFGQPWPRGFLWLHMTLLGVMLAKARRVFGWRGFWAVLVITVLSPSLWFLDKAHTEILTVFSVTMALLFVAEGRVLPSAAALAFGAAQNAALSVPSALLAVWGASRWWNGRRDRFDLLALFTAIALNALSPLYYLYYYGQVSLITAAGHASIENISLKRMLSIFIDPNVGLLPNWPLGLAAVVAGLVSWAGERLRGKPEVSREQPNLMVFIWVFVLTLLPIHASQNNHSHGGTVHVIRYTLWYLPLWVPLLVSLMEQLKSRLRQIWAVALIVVLGALNTLWYLPTRLEVNYEFSPAAKWIYEHFPSWHNPVKEVWFERSTALGDLPIRDGRNVDLPGVWAAADPSCRKVLILVEGLTGDNPAPPKPTSCEQPVDGRALRAMLAREYGDTLGDFYLTLPHGLLNRVRPLLPPGEIVNMGEASAETYLGAGWSIGETTGRWLKSARADLGFRMGTYASGLMKLEAGVLIPDGHDQQRISVEVNGMRKAEWTWSHQHVAKTVEVELTADANGYVRINLVPSAPHPAAPDDRRTLSLYVFRFWWETPQPPDPRVFFGDFESSGLNGWSRVLP